MKKQQKLPIFPVHLTPNQLSSKHPSQKTASVSKLKGLLFSAPCHITSLRKKTNCLLLMQNENRGIIFSYYCTTLFYYLLMLWELLISTFKLHIFQPIKQLFVTLKYIFSLLDFSKIVLHLILLSTCNTVVF